MHTPSMINIYDPTKCSNNNDPSAKVKKKARFKAEEPRTLQPDLPDKQQDKFNIINKKYLKPRKRFSLRAISQVHSSDTETDSHTDTNKDKDPEDQDAAMVQEFLRLWDLTYARQDVIYPLRIAGHRVTLRATVDTGSMISTMAAATVFYLKKYYPRSVNVVSHEPQQFVKHRPGNNFNRRFGLHLDAHNDVVDFRGSNDSLESFQDMEKHPDHRLRRQTATRAKLKRRIQKMLPPFGSPEPLNKTTPSMEEDLLVLETQLHSSDQDGQTIRSCAPSFRELSRLLDVQGETTRVIPTQHTEPLIDPNHVTDPVLQSSLIIFGDSNTAGSRYSSSSSDKSYRPPPNSAHIEDRSPIITRSKSRAQQEYTRPSRVDHPDTIFADLQQVIQNHEFSIISGTQPNAESNRTASNAPHFNSHFPSTSSKSGSHISSTDEYRPHKTTAREGTQILELNHIPIEPDPQIDGTQLIANSEIPPDYVFVSSVLADDPILSNFSSDTMPRLFDESSCYPSTINQSVNSDPPSLSPHNFSPEPQVNSSVPTIPLQQVHDSAIPHPETHPKVNLISPGSINTPLFPFHSLTPSPNRTTTTPRAPNIPNPFLNPPEFTIPDLYVSTPGPHIVVTSPDDEISSVVRNLKLKPLEELLQPPESPSSLAMNDVLPQSDKNLESTQDSSQDLFSSALGSTHLCHNAPHVQSPPQRLGTQVFHSSSQNLLINSEEINVGSDANINLSPIAVAGTKSPVRRQSPSPTLIVPKIFRDPQTPTILTQPLFSSQPKMDWTPYRIPCPISESNSCPPLNSNRNTIMPTTSSISNSKDSVQIWKSQSKSSERFRGLPESDSELSEQKRTIQESNIFPTIVVSYPHTRTQSSDVSETLLGAHNNSEITLANNSEFPTNPVNCHGSTKLNVSTPAPFHNLLSPDKPEQNAGIMASAPITKRLTSDEIIILKDLLISLDTVIWNRNWGMALTQAPPEVDIEKIDHASDYIAEIQRILLPIRAAASRAAEQVILHQIRRILMALSEHVQEITLRDDTIRQFPTTQQATQSTTRQLARLPAVLETPQKGDPSPSASGCVVKVRSPTQVVPYVKGFTVTGTQHPSWIMKWTVYRNCPPPDAPLAAPVPTQVPDFYTSFLFSNIIVEDIFPLQKGRISGARKFGDNLQVSVILDPRQYGTTVRQIRILGPAPQIRCAQKAIHFRIQQLGLTLWEPSVTVPKISTQYTLHSWRHPNPKRVIEFEVPACGFFNNQNHTCLEPHFMRDHPGCFKCGGDNVNHSSAHCPDYPVGIEDESHVYRYTQLPPQ
ncbi:unnamed protein product [Allacma fusca]|uniref:Uncharacterized protein n=1 Tax=Allacma fusca TaxID=39272 RepID=A0A8J2K6M0_9HEXA|nr:unnamed protein product [Allacma fusca]